MKTENVIDFESSLKELENIILKLEKGECSLEESIALFESGIKHTENCKEALNNAKKRIIDLTEAELEERELD